MLVKLKKQSILSVAQCGACGAGVRARVSQVGGCGFSPCVAVWVFLPGAPIKTQPHLVATSGKDSRPEATISYQTTVAIPHRDIYGKRNYYFYVLQQSRINGREAINLISAYHQPDQPYQFEQKRSCAILPLYSPEYSLPLQSTVKV